MVDKEPEFTGPEEKLSYYRTLATEYKRRFSDAQRDLEEFQEGSRDLEVELEAQLTQSETKNKELAQANEQLKQQNDRLQVKVDDLQCENTSLRDKVQHLQMQREDMQKYVRKLEQKNDDFERATRASLMSIEDFESRLNQAIERNAFLENELDEKENMATLIQRLKDEARDLKQELCVNDTFRNHDILPPTPPKTPEATPEIHREELKTYSVSPACKTSAFLKSSSSYVPHSALNILGDLLKKVGVLESKLQSCRESIKEGSDSIVENRGSRTSSRVRHSAASSVSSLKDFIPLTA